MQRQRRLFIRWVSDYAINGFRLYHFMKFGHAQKMHFGLVASFRLRPLRTAFGGLAAPLNLALPFFILFQACRQSEVSLIDAKVKLRQAGIIAMFGPYPTNPLRNIIFSEKAGNLLRGGLGRLLTKAPTGEPKRFGALGSREGS